MDDDNEDPPGVAAPPDPHGDDRDGVGRDGRYRGQSQSDSHCAKCGKPIRPSKRLCRRCRDEKLQQQTFDKSDESAGDSQDRTVEWVFDRVGLAVVTATLDISALAYGRAALRKREDMGIIPTGYEERDTFDALDDLDSEPHEVLQGDWPPLQAAVEFDSEPGQQLLDTALERLADTDSPILYDENGTPIKDVEAPADLREAVVGDGNIWLVPGFLYELSVEEPDETTDLLEKTMLHCLEENKRTLHVYQGASDGIDWWVCQDCGYDRAGPVPFPQD